MSSEQLAGNSPLPGQDLRDLQKKQIDILQRQLESAREANLQLRENGIERMQEVFQFCQERLEVQNEKMQEMGSVCRSQNDMLAESCDQIKALQKEVTEQRQLVQALEQEKLKSEEHINSLETINQGFQMQNQKLQAQNTELEREIQQLEDQHNKQVQQYQLELESYSRQLQEAELQNCQLTTNIEDLQSKLEAVAQCNNMLVGMGSRREAEDLNLCCGVQNCEEHTGVQQSKAAAIQQDNNDSLTNQGSSNKENTPMCHQNRGQLAEVKNLSTTEKTCIIDSKMSNQKTGVNPPSSIQNTSGEDNNSRIQMEAEIMMFSDSRQDMQCNNNNNNKSPSVCPVVFNEFETVQIDCWTWRYVHQDLDLEFSIKSIPSMDGQGQRQGQGSPPEGQFCWGQQKYRFLWIKRGNIVPRFWNHSIEFSPDMIEKFREDFLQKTLPFLQAPQ